MARETQGGPASEKKLEQYGVWVKVKPHDVKAAPVLEESFELSDLEAPRSSARESVAVEESALTAEEEKLLDDLETELEPENESRGAAVPEEEPLLDDAELPDIETVSSKADAIDLEFEAPSDEELPELEEGLEPSPLAAHSRRSGSAEGHGKGTADVEVTLSEGLGDQDQFDDLAALESELASVTTGPRDASTSSAGILARIEDELRSIRTDLNQLRSDLSGLRRSAAKGTAERPAAETGPAGRFFDEDDETIALTGDELDNILNTAEITEESAEAPGAADADILSFETPSAEPVEADTTLADLEEVEEAALADDTLTLPGDELLPLEGTNDASSAATSEFLPSDLVLEELSVEEGAGTPAQGKGASELPEIDLEGIPELEAEPSLVPATAESTGKDDGSETIDLETLDLGEEPTVIEAVPERVDDLEELEEAEELLEEETPAGAKSPRASGGGPAEEVDLEALAAEAEELEAGAPAAPAVEDLEIGELESLTDEAAPAAPARNEIEIDFEKDAAGDLQAADELVGIEEAAPAEEILEAEEVPAKPAAAGASAAGIPDNLKDEIRTVLQYMDHLLEALPDDKIKEFAGSDYFVMYKKLFEDLGLGE